MTDQETKAVLAGPKSYTSLRQLEPVGVAFAVTAQRTNLIPLVIVGLVAGPLGVALSLWLMQRPPPSWAGPGWPMYSLHQKLLVVSCILTALGPLLLMIRLVAGPPRNAQFEASPGHLLADRYIAGDHVRAVYTADEVLSLFIESEVLCIETGKGQSQLIAYGKPSINQAIGFLLARNLWPEYPIDVIRLRRPFLSNLPERIVFAPQREQCGTGEDTSENPLTRTLFDVSKHTPGVPEGTELIMDTEIEQRRIKPQGTRSRNARLMRCPVNDVLLRTP